MPEPETLQGLVVIGPSSTLLLFGRAAELLLPHFHAAEALGPEVNLAILDALQRLGSAIVVDPEASVSWRVVDLRSPRVAPDEHS